MIRKTILHNLFLWSILVSVSAIPGLLFSKENYESIVAKILAIITFVLAYTIINSYIELKTRIRLKYKKFFFAYKISMLLRVISIPLIIFLAFESSNDYILLYTIDFWAGYISIVVWEMLRFGEMGVGFIDTFALTILTGTFLSLIILLEAVVFMPLIKLIKNTDKSP